MLYGNNSNYRSRVLCATTGTFSTVIYTATGGTNTRIECLIGTQHIVRHIHSTSLLMRP